VKALSQKSTIISCGLAMFAMFFGAGNIVFPLALGQVAQDKNLYAIMGMILTAVLVPLVGLLAMLLYEGDYASFFKRVGRVPGFLLAAIILALIGPFGGIPRCIAISYATLSSCGLESFVSFNLPLFSLVSCAVIFLFTMKQNQILNLLGYVLTPILLLSLGAIALKGTFLMPHAVESLATRSQSFFEGLVGGYNTMDLLAAFFFSSVVLLCLKQGAQKNNESGQLDKRSLITIATAGSLIAAVLLALVYVSFSFLAAGYSQTLDGVEPQQLLGSLAFELLGPYAGLVAGVAVAFACLTTEIALTAIFAEFLHKTLTRGRLSYPLSLVATLLVAFVVSTLHFQGISAFLGPILQICYPALIALTLLNLLNKIYDFKPVKRIFYFVVATSALYYIFL